MIEVRIGINGFGRIGRAVTRIIQKQDNLKLVAVNDIDPNVENHAYLCEFDTTYGQYEGDVSVNGDHISIDDDKVIFYSEETITDVPWENNQVDVVIDSSGVHQNVLDSRELVDKNRVSKVVVTHEPDSGLDHTVIFGVNEGTYDPDKHDIVGSSICDANAIAPAVDLLDHELGVEQGFVTTLHPWLSYQNLVDGSVRSVSSPGHFWDDFQLGRASDKNMIPKDTTAVDAIGAVDDDIPEKIQAMSFRTPTSIVSISDITIRLGTETTTDRVNDIFKLAAEERPNIFGYNKRPLVSSDFKGIRQSFMFDSRWTDVQQGNQLHMILWYDNEWGYSERVVDTAKLVSESL